ncbi:hypothetical protein [Gordonia sp. MP11Mi]|uniref:hypothetical protein n=1 Tax=Gordonia sp. MP11Mi TaxID=3022769 RepID=UPI003B21B5D2
MTFADMIGMTVEDLYAMTGYSTGHNPRATIVVVPMDSAAKGVGLKDQVISAACGSSGTVTASTVWLAVYSRVDIPPDVREQIGRKSLLPRDALIDQVPKCPNVAESLAY